MTQDASSAARPEGSSLGGGVPSAFLSPINLLQKSRYEIGAILKTLDEAKYTLDILEENMVDVPISSLPKPDDLAERTYPDESMRLAQYLYEIALKCRDLVKDARLNKFLQSVGYTISNTELLFTAFENLVDVWSTYGKVIDCLDIAAWDTSPSPDRIWAALENPRRRYIRALNAYYVQLSVVVSKLPPGQDVTSGA